ncbi:MAG: IPTL-CTERM sorting domain-containing protein [FCB group bacterium]|nr:IPTL-CTERM sorting domain-containing protein [FCB group bacterium]
MKKLLILTVLAMFVASTAMAATYTVRVSKLPTVLGTEINPSVNKDIMVVPNDLVLAPGDQIEMVLDSNLWCDDDPGSIGEITVLVPTNTAGFEDSTYHFAEPGVHADQTQAITGAVDDYDIENVIFTITLDDPDCTTELVPGANIVELRLYCNRDVPTLSEWGLIIFSLLILTLITVVMTRRKRAMAGA